jgi:hypothetical protein
MEIIRARIPLSRVRSRYMTHFPAMTKLVIDIGRRILAIDADLHADEEEALLDDGSRQEHLWGCNLYPDRPGDQAVEYTSLINIRPSQNNMAMVVQDPAIRQEISTVIGELIDFDA